MRPFAFLILFLLAAIPTFGEDQKTGTLIVTYHTGPKAERLDRVRFWLKQPNHEPQMYPRANFFVEDPTNQSRKVVIDYLDPGEYTIEFIVPNADKLFDEIHPRTVTIQPEKVVKLDQPLRPRYATLRASTTSITEGMSFTTLPTITLKDSHGNIRAQSPLGKFVVRNLLPGDYLLVFEKVDGFKTPHPVNLKLGPNECLGPIEGIYEAGVDEDLSENIASNDPLHKVMGSEIILKTVLVPEGKSIIGDQNEEQNSNELPARTIMISSFYIGTYEVTNAQYALWLNKALKENKIDVQTDTSNRGQIRDKNGKLLCKTIEADPHSQILIQSNSAGIEFLPVIGKHNFPVINVSWYGAKAFCIDNQCRLPTEAEWEKSAGMAAAQAGKPLKKYKYGFGRDEIDFTWANYKENDFPIQEEQVMTTRVGFYNGFNTLILNSTTGKEIATNLAKSPVGAFDMSGNVWEWVEDWYDDMYYHHMPQENPQGPPSGIKKVAKGGCYNSLKEGVRVSERIGLPPEHTDIYTGFRVAVDK